MNTRTAPTRTPRQIRADRVDNATPGFIGGMVATCAVAGVLSIFSSPVVTCVVAGVLAAATIGLFFGYIETGFGCEE